MNVCKLDADRYDTNINTIECTSRMRNALVALTSVYTSVAVLADTSVNSPGKLMIFAIRFFLVWVKASQKSVI